MKAYKNKQQQGFTLIELMIVVAIIGVLSAIAVPAYKNYVAKSEAASALATMKSLITPAELIYQDKGSVSTGLNLVNELGISAGSNTLGDIEISAENTIKFTFKNSSLDSQTLTLKREASGWVCTFSKQADIPLKGCIAAQ
ncbi:pilin [Vibrio cholerae]|uniref:pilin n=1 Tax=Vibrio cholerae TaxID=666 RepID=UPI002FE663C8|nr:pilin [Vibrio cholerae]